MKLSRRSLLSSGAAIVPVAGLGPAIAAADGFRSSRPGDGDDRSFHGYGELAQGSRRASSICRAASSIEFFPPRTSR